MKYLLDTHTLIWYSENDPNLPFKVKELFDDSNSEFYISIATLWEMSLKIRKGTLIINRNFDEVIDLIFNSGFKFLPISYQHIKELLKLPLYHKDPFDRMLISQTIYEDMTILSNEVLFDSYGVKRYWLI